MSYDDALQQLRDVEVATPAFIDVEQRRRWHASLAIPLRALREATVATSFAVVGYLALTLRPVVDSLTQQEGYLVEWWRGSLSTLLPAVLMLWAIKLLHRRGVGPQMLARAVLWSNLVVGTLIAMNFLTLTDRCVGAAIAVACAVAIVRLGSHGLDDGSPDELFQPVRFRGHLLLALVMAFADAQTLMFSALMQLRVGIAGWNLVDTIVYAGPITVAAVVMALAVWGLYRLRTWALILNLVANIAIAYFAIEGALNVSTAVAGALAATAAVQMFLPVPIFAVALGDRRAGQPMISNHAQRLLRVSVIVIATIAVAAAAFVTNPPGWLTGPGRAFRRGLEVGSLQYQRVRHLEHTDLSDRDLDAQDFSNARMRGAKLRRASGSARFNSADLRDADLRDARLSGSTFNGADLAGADLRGADLGRAQFARATLTGADLRGAQLELADLQGAHLARADLRGANLRGAVFSGPLTSGPELADAVCPESTRADATEGCRGRMGEVDGADPRYRGVFRRAAGGDWTASRHCRSLSTHTLIPDRYLHFVSDRFVRVGEDRFESARATLIVDRSRAPARLEYTRNGCGTALFEQIY